MGDRATGIVVCALGMLMFIATRQLPLAVLGDPTGPILLPLMLSWALIGLGALLVLQAGTNRGGERIWAGGRPLALVVALLAAYVAAFTLLGYLLATTVMLFLLLAIYNPGRWRLNVLVAIIFSVLAYLLFHQLLGVYVPPGVIG